SEAEIWDEPPHHPPEYFRYDSRPSRANPRRPATSNTDAIRSPRRRWPAVPKVTVLHLKSPREARIWSAAALEGVSISSCRAKVGLKRAELLKECDEHSEGNGTGDRNCQAVLVVRAAPGRSSGRDKARREGRHDPSQVDGRADHRPLGLNLLQSTE